MANQILAQLALQSRVKFDDEIVDLKAGKELPPDQSSDLAYFPHNGLISITASHGSRSIDVAFLGREGMIGAGLVHSRKGGMAKAFVRVSGQASVISGEALRSAVAANPVASEIIQNVASLSLEQAGLALCAASCCSIEQRLAGWLLMAHNRLDSDALEITHESMANALGVRRPGVTVALHVLEGRHGVRANRGRIMIRSRDALIDIAGLAYRDVFYGRVPAAEAPDRQEGGTNRTQGASFNMSLKARMRMISPASSAITNA